MSPSNVCCKAASSSIYLLTNYCGPTPYTPVIHQRGGGKKGAFSTPLSLSVSVWGIVSSLGGGVI